MSKQTETINTLRFVPCGHRRYLYIADDATMLAQAAAGFTSAAVSASEPESGRFTLALSGGRTPAMLYEALVKNHGDSPDWPRVDFFWSDERMVSHDHADSNYRLAHLGLLQPLAVSSQQIFAVATEHEPAVAAARYQQTILDRMGPVPMFDMIFLGLGEDGHTASLFPGTAALAEQSAFVAANHVAKLQSWRITFTYPLLRLARRIVFLVSGAGKAQVLAGIMAGTSNLPAALVHPVNGDVYWLMDQDAGAMLEKVL